MHADLALGVLESYLVLKCLYAVALLQEVDDVVLKLDGVVLAGPDLFKWQARLNLTLWRGRVV
jgi:hypothetical protein